MSIFLALLGTTLITLAVSHFVGMIVLRLLRVQLARDFFSIFARLLVGITVLVVGYAIWRTRGVTVLLPLPILLIFPLKREFQRFKLYQSDKLTPSAEILAGWYQWLILIGTGLLLFTARYFTLYDSTSEFLRTPFQDYVYYGRLSMPLNLLGTETNTLETVYPQFVTEQPYHYFEIWFNALLVWATGLPAAWCLYLSAYSVLITLVALGYMAILAQFRVRQPWIPMLGVLLLTVTGVGWPILKDWAFFHNGGLIASSILLLQPKLALVYAIFILVVLLLVRGRYISAGIAAAAAPISFISTSPVIGMGLVVLVIYLWKTRQIRFTDGISLLLPIFIVCVFMVGFYVLQPEPFKFPDTGRSFVFSTIVPALSETRVILNIAVGSLVNFALYFGAYGLLVVLLLRRRLISELRSYKGVLVWFIACLFFGALFRAFGTHYVDSFQFFSNTMIPLTAVTVAVLVALGLAHARQRWYGITAAALLGLIGINCWDLVIDIDKALVTTRYSPQFLRAVQAVAPELGSRGAYVLADADYENAFMLSPDSYTSGTYISNFKNNYAFATLSTFVADSLTTDPRFLRDSVQAQQAQRRSTFYRFSKFQALSGHTLPPDSAMRKFVVQAGISFICVSQRAVLPVVLRTLVKACYADALSGEKLYVLRTRSTMESTGSPYWPQARPVRLR